jgi:hypothetical protein
VEVDHFAIILQSYNEKDRLIEELKKFARQLEEAKYDFHLVKTVTDDESVAGMNSMISSFVKFILNEHGKLEVIPNHEIFWFYTDILLHAQKFTSTMTLVYEMLHELEHNGKYK